LAGSEGDRGWETLKMKIGARAHTVSEVKEIAQQGFPFAEISILDAERFCKEDVDVLKRIRDETGVFYLAHGPEEGNAFHPDILERKLLPELRSIMDCLQLLSIDVLTIHFWMDERFIDKSVIDEKILLLKDINSYALNKGIHLCIENLSESCRDFLPLFQQIEGLSMTLDMGHGELLSKTNTAYGFITTCFDRIKHVHIHDNAGGNSPADDLHLPLGEGRIDFSSILLDLTGKGYDNTITLEVKTDYIADGKAFIENILLQGE